MRLVRLALVLLAAAALATALSACATFKTGSLQVAQPEQIGPLHVRLGACSMGETPSPEPACTASNRTGQGQVMLGLAVPQGAPLPDTISASSSPGAPSITLRRNQEVTEQMEALTPPEGVAWPPAGDAIVGYLSDVFTETEGEEADWTIDVATELPRAPDGGPTASPAAVTVAWGWRVVEEGHPADRPIDCEEYGYGEFGIPYFYGGCQVYEEVAAGTSDLKLSSTSASVAAGGTASVAFTLEAASSAEPPPSFSLAAASSAPGSHANPARATYTPGSFDPETHRAPPVLVPVEVSVPASAVPGTYDVTLTATTGSGGSVSAVGRLTVTSAPAAPAPQPPTLKLGRVKLNKRKGTATIAVAVSEAGTLAVSGKKVRALRRKASGPTSLKVTLRARGKAKKALAKRGKAKITARLTFTSASGASASATRSLTLKRVRRHRRR